ncbi:MAG TPA: hypothetical protein VLH77_05870 [Gammaproteobacteria bacterium]|nr:hypothetical protein [Gammaproteobacteria bacterium]
MSAGKIEKLSSMTDAQLRAYLFDEHFDQMSFAQVTAAYMQDMTQTEASSMKNISETMNTETDVQKGFTDLCKELNDQYITALNNQPSTSSMPDWLSDVIGGLMVAISILTLNPVAIGMSCAMFAMNFTVGGKSLMSMMTEAAVGDDPSKKASFEFGFALGMAACGGAASAASGVTEAAAEAGATTTGLFVKSTLTNLGQTLMMDNFWPDFFQGVCKMSPEDAAILGMFVGITFGMASAAKAAASEDGMTAALRSKVASMGDKALRMIRLINVGLNLVTDGFRAYQGGQEIEISQQYKTLANYQRDVMAPTMSKLGLVQALSAGIGSMLTVTQNLLQSESDTSNAINQTFASFADMFIQPKN